MTIHPPPRPLPLDRDALRAALASGPAVRDVQWHTRCPDCFALVQPGEQMLLVDGQFCCIECGIL